MSVKYAEIEKYKSNISYKTIFFLNFKNLFIRPVEKYDKTKSRPQPRISLIKTIDQ